jgi:hypothetical protein
LRSKIKVPRRSLRYATHRLMVMHIRTIIQWTVLLDLFELFDLQVKDQGSTKVITVCNTPPHGHAPTYQLSLTYLEDNNVMAQTRKYYLKNNYLTLRSKVKVPRRSLRYVTHRLMAMHIRNICPWTVLLDLFELFDLEVKDQGPTKVITVRDTPPYGHVPTYQLSLTYLERQKYYGTDKKILFKKQLFDIEVKVPRRSLRFATHRLMVMHPYTKYHWPISKDKKVMVWISFAEKKWKKQKKKSD